MSKTKICRAVLGAGSRARYFTPIMLFEKEGDVTGYK